MLFLTLDQMRTLRVLAKLRVANPEEGKSIKLCKSVYLHKVKGASLLTEGKRYYVHLKDFSQAWADWKPILFDGAPMPLSNKKTKEVVRICEAGKENLGSYMDQVMKMRSKITTGEPHA